MIAVLTWVFTIAAVILVLYYLFPIVTVCGLSMYDTYLDGEIILATRLFLKSRIKKNDVVIYHAPEDGKIVIKRVDDIDLAFRVMYCLGDNPDESYDSRSYGYVPIDRLIAVPIVQRKKKER